MIPPCSVLREATLTPQDCEILTPLGRARRARSPGELKQQL
jgi:hypothetical protein